jgi:hypothetical protein
VNKKKIFFFICYLILALVLFSAINSAIEGEKGKIRRLIFIGQRAIEKEDLIRLSGYTSFDYQDKYGNDRQRLIFIAQKAFVEYQDISLQIKDLKIELNESEALAQMGVLGLGRRASGAQNDNPLEYDRVELKIRFKKEGKQWKVVELDFLESEEFFPLGEFISLRKIDSYNQKNHLSQEDRNGITFNFGNSNGRINCGSYLSYFSTARQNGRKFRRSFIANGRFKG